MSTSQPIRVLVVDDHEMVRRGLVSYLETEDGIEVVGEASDGSQAVKFCRDLTPDVILMDLIMQETDGITATKEIKAEFPHVQVIILTSFVDEKLIFPALEAGALSYLLKTSTAEEIVKAIRSARESQSIIEPQVASRMVSRIQSASNSRPPHEELTQRELEVLRLIGEGMTNQEIAEKLFIGIKTVKTHVSNILSKLGVADRTQAAVYAHRHNLV
ncbi:MAG TPA: response regulator transcription factor [Firmicutes bacterium]|nr:response regulator transcription factor [Bacillota bacterium]